MSRPSVLVDQALRLSLCSALRRSCVVVYGQEHVVLDVRPSTGMQRTTWNIPSFLLLLVFPLPTPQTHKTRWMDWTACTRLLQSSRVYDMSVIPSDRAKSLNKQQHRALVCGLLPAKLVRSSLDTDPLFSHFCRAKCNGAYHPQAVLAFTLASALMSTCAT